jgi:hypothetical protein
LSWPDEYFSQVLTAVIDTSLAIVLQTADEQLKEKIHRCLAKGRKKRLEDLFSGSVSPTDISNAYLKMIESTRKIATSGELKFEHFDQALIIAEDIEDKLKKGHFKSDSSHLGIVPAATNGPDIDNSYEPKSGLHQVDTSNLNDEALRNEVFNLKKKLAILIRENNNLKAEVAACKTKLDQIRRIA